MIDPRALNWTMDSYVEEDLPAIIAAVREHTGARRVHWVGHSMGGMVALTYVELYGDDQLASLTVLGSPMTIPQPPNNFLEAIKGNRDLFKLMTLVVNASVPASLHVIDEKTGIAGALYNPRNMSDTVTREFFTRGIEDIPTGVLDQLVGAVATGSLHSADGATDYAQLLGRVKLPCFVAGGMVDHVAPPESIRYVYNHIASTDKQFHIYALVNNDEIDYGHLDLVIGTHAPTDVYPSVEGWLAAHPRSRK
jgi:pimeloyl-ACP methyl ester carboxylesterase